MRTSGATSTNGQTVDTWVDQSPAGNNLTIMAGNIGPVLNTTGFNTSYPALMLDGTSRALGRLSYAIGTGTTFTAFIVTKMSTGSALYGRLLCYTKPGATAPNDNAGSALFLLRDAGSNAINGAANGTFCTAGALALDAHAIVASIFTGSVFSVYVNNIRAGTGTAYTNAFATGGKLEVGIDVSGTNWVGPISELILCNADNTANATNIYNYLKAKWGL
jgi:hypothetical protein